MDVLTSCFEEEGWDVSHFTFPRVFYTPKVKPPEGTSVKCFFAKKSIIPYVDRYMHWLPHFLFNFVKFTNNRSARKMDFSLYDVIVLESGKPLFLMDIIPDHIPIVYRLSDSVQFVLGKNKWYHQLEKDVFEKSFRMIFKKEVYRSNLLWHQKKKTTIIENGMVIPENLDEQRVFPEDSINGVYVGLHPLDFSTLAALLAFNQDTQFHIIGPCLTHREIRKLSIYQNFHYYSFLTKEKYMPLLRDADFALFPFKRTESMKWFGLTSKFLHFMYFHLPIISYPTGHEGEFEGIPVIFAQSIEDFVAKTAKVIEQKEKIEYPINFTYYSSSNRKKEYKDFIRKLYKDIN